MILADTTFLIDLQRGRHNPRHEAAAKWLAEHRGEEIALPAIVLGEFTEGFESPTHAVVEHYRTAHRIIEVDVQVAMTYARLSRDLRSTGTPIGGNDTWIAATALAHQAPLLTRNTAHFGRVGGLTVLRYESS